MNNPLISVIVPVYKVEKYLDRCVESIVNQTYTNLEIILVDDGSPDNCPKMCDDWAKKDSRIKVIHKENGGLSSARNAGLDFMTGEYLFFVDSDDFITNDAIFLLLSALQNDETLLAFASIESKRNSFLGVYSLGFYGKIDAKLCLDNLNRCISACNKLFHKRLWDARRFKEGILYEDAELIYKIYLDLDYITVLDNVTYVYCENDLSITSQTFHIKQLGIIDIMQEQLDCFKEKRLKTAYKNDYGLFCHRLKVAYYNAINGKKVTRPFYYKKLLIKYFIFACEIGVVFNIKFFVNNLAFVLFSKVYFKIRPYGNYKMV